MCITQTKHSGEPGLTGHAPPTARSCGLGWLGLDRSLGIANEMWFPGVRCGGVMHRSSADCLFQEPRTGGCRTIHAINQVCLLRGRWIFSVGSDRELGRSVADCQYSGGEGDATIYHLKTAAKGGNRVGGSQNMQLNEDRCVHREYQRCQWCDAWRHLSLDSCIARPWLPGYSYTP